MSHLHLNCCVIWKVTPMVPVSSRSSYPVLLYQCLLFTIKSYGWLVGICCQFFCRLEVSLQLLHTVASAAFFWPDWLQCLHCFPLGTNLNSGLLSLGAGSTEQHLLLHLLAQQTEHWAPKEGTWGRWLMPGAGNPMHPEQLCLEHPVGLRNLGVLCGFDPTSSCVQPAFALQREKLGNWGCCLFIKRGKEWNNS